MSETQRPPLPEGSGVTYLLRVVRDKWHRRRKIASLQKELARLQGDLRSYLVALAVKARREAVEAAVVQEHETRLNEADAATGSLSAEYDQAVKRRAEIQSQIQAAENDIRDARATLDRARKERTQLEQGQAPPSTESAVKRADLAKQIQQAEQTLAQRRDEAAALRTELAQANQAVASAAAGKTTASGASEQLLFELGEAAAGDSDLAARFADDAALVEDTREKIASTEETIAGYTTDLSRYDQSKLITGKILLGVSIVLPILFLHPIYVSARTLARRDAGRIGLRFVVCGLLLAIASALWGYTEGHAVKYRNRAGSLDFHIASVFRDAIAANKGVLCTQNHSGLLLWGGKCSAIDRDKAAAWKAKLKTCWEYARAPLMDCAGGAYPAQSDVEYELQQLEEEISRQLWDGRTWSVGSFFTLLVGAYFFFVFACLIWTKRAQLWPSTATGGLVVTVAIVSIGAALAVVLSTGIGASIAGEEKPAAVALIFGAPIALAPLAAAVRLFVAKGNR